jgi:RimJ/RimL family protein N-acetyltransferase
MLRHGAHANPPERITTERLLLRRWRTDDAPHLEAVLTASVTHLRPWIPWTIAEPAPLAELEARIARFSSNFDAGREWLWAILSRDERELLGGLGLYPRSATARVPLVDADRVEIGYWLGTGATGRGYATEAVQALLAIADALPGISRIEIRCDPRNEASVAIPRRLGFTLARALEEASMNGAGARQDTMVWERATAPARPVHSEAGRPT